MADAQASFWLSEAGLTGRSEQAWTHAEARAGLQLVVVPASTSKEAGISYIMGYFIS